MSRQNACKSSFNYCIYMQTNRFELRYMSSHIDFNSTFFPKIYCFSLKISIKKIIIKIIATTFTIRKLRTFVRTHRTDEGNVDEKQRWVKMCLNIKFLSIRWNRKEWKRWNENKNNVQMRHVAVMHDCCAAAAAAVVFVVSRCRRRKSSALNYRFNIIRLPLPIKRWLTASRLLWYHDN